MERLKNKVKIVCTIGPACSEYETLLKMSEAGMNVARLNFSHGDYDSHGKNLQNIRAVEEERKTPIAVLLDTKGPEIRTGELKDHKTVTLKAGNDFKLFFEKREGDENGVYVDYTPLAKEVEPGQNIYIDDGAIALEVIETSPEEILCRITVGSELGEHKGINVPGANLSVPTLTEKDISDLRWGAEHEVDFVAVSFVRTKEDIIEVRKVLEECGAAAKIIAKMETRQSVENIDEILPIVDGMMVARGDLGVEMNIEDVPIIQKEIISKCRQLGKPVIVATQMLESMTKNPRPTRAEANDVANAVIDGADAVMLSGETANGKYPVKTIETMRKIIISTEKNSKIWNQAPVSLPETCETGDAVSLAARVVSGEVSASAIVTITLSGSTAKMIAKYRPDCQIIAVTSSKSTMRRLALSWGIITLMNEFDPDWEVSVEKTLHKIEEEDLVKFGDNVVFTLGAPIYEPGGTNTLYVHRVGSIAGKGQSIVRSRMTGSVVLAESPEEAEAKAGADKVLVIKESSSDYIPAFKEAGAIITEEGSITSFAGIISLERGIPCICGVPGITEKVKEGSVVTVDGYFGIVYLEKR
ncbi:MAG: pyruvate kinase [Synergistes sp.]|nr:pyruvate kinase [Synergistes sp.]